MKIFNNIIERLKRKKKFSFKSLLNKLKHIFKLRSWQVKVSLIALIIVIGSSLFLVYGQSGSISSAPSLTRGLIAHYTMDADDYEEGTVNLAPLTDYSNRNFNTVYSASCWGGDVATVEYFKDGGYNNLPYKKMTKTGSGTGGCYIDEYYGIAIENNKSYVVSAWMKASRNISSMPAYILGINRTVDNQYRNGPAVSLTTEWKRYSWVYNAGSDHAGIYSNRGIVYENNNLPLEVYWSGFQVEEGTKLTDYANNLRSSRVIDKTSYSNHGINYGATSAIDRNGKEGGAMKFNGVDSYINISPNLPIESFSLWIDFSNTKKVEYFFGSGLRSYNGIRYDGSSLLFYGSLGTSALTHDFGNAYVNLVGVRSNNNWYIYKNGEYIGIISNVGIIDLGYIGKRGDGYYFSGSIDDVRIYNRAISEKEASLLYDSYEPKTQVSSINSGLIGHWTLSSEDYNSSTGRLTDKTPYENHSTKIGASFMADSSGKDMGAMSFTNSPISMTNKSSLYRDSISISFWAYHTDLAYPKTFGAIKRSITCYAAGGKGWDFGHGLSSNGVDVCVADGSKGVRNQLTFNVGSRPSDLLNKWAHVVYIIDRNLNKVFAYVNGVKQSSSIDISAITGNIYSDSNLEVGGMYGWGVQGALSDLRMYNRVLSDDEVSLLYNSPSHKSGGNSLQKGLVLDMPLTSEYTKSETLGSQIMIDKTPFQNHGQNFGGVVGSDGILLANTGNRVETSFAVPNKEGTISIWYKPLYSSIDPNMGSVIYSTGATWVDNSFSFDFRNCCGNPYDNILYMRGTGASYLSFEDDNPKWEVGDWINLVITYSSKNFIKKYTNTKLSASNGGVNNSDFNFPNKFIIGALSSSGTSAKGVVSRLKVYDRVLSIDEIKLLYEQDASYVGGTPVYLSSCKKILEASSSNGSGVYKIQPIPTEPPFSVYCDMTTDGGGWTLVEKDYGGSATVPVNSINDTNTSILLDQSWSDAEGKFADSKFKAIWLSGDRELLWRKSTGENVKMRFSEDYINNIWFSNFHYASRPNNVFQEFYRYADGKWYAINGHSNNWHFSNYADTLTAPYSTYRQSKDQNDNNAYWPTRTTGLMDTQSWMFHMYIR